MSFVTTRLRSGVRRLREPAWPLRLATGAGALLAGVAALHAAHRPHLQLGRDRRAATCPPGA